MERRVTFEGIQNFRDLGGYPTNGGGAVRWGRVFRADALHKLTEADLETFAGLGVRTVFDLRGDVERAEFPGPFDSIHLSILGRPEDAEVTPPDPDLTTADGEGLLRDLYVGALTHSAAKFGVLLTALADPDRVPAVFHCHGGKDRTGIVAALLLRALGVDREVVLDDYEATRRYRTLEHQQDSLASMLAAGVPPEAAAGVLGAPRWAMAEALDAVDATFDGIDAYLTGPAAMTTEALQRLRALLVQPPARAVEQAGYQVRFDWGVRGAAAIGADADVVVWSDAIAPAPPGPELDGLVPGAAVISADLRTAGAAAKWVAALQLRLRRRITIAVVAAGAPRADGSTRWAVEDHLAAGAVIASLGALGIDATSPESAVADAAYRGLERAVGHLVTASVAGRASSFVPSMFSVDPDLDAAAVAVLRPHPQG